MVVIVIIGLLATIVAVNVLPATGKARTEKAKADIATLEQALDQYRLDNITRSEEHTSELQSLMRISYAVFCLKKKSKTENTKKVTSTYRIIINKCREYNNKKEHKT